MTDQLEPTVTLIANPYMEGTHYGIPVSCLGEDGDVIALGHHDDDKTREAFRAHLDLSIDLDHQVRRGWATFRKPQPGNESEEEFVWIAEDASVGTPGALAVTYLDL